MAPITMIVVGCGSRGTVYSNIALDEPDRAKVVAVCDPRDHFRLVLGEDCLQRLICLSTEAYKCLQRLIPLFTEAYTFVYRGVYVCLQRLICRGL